MKKKSRILYLLCSLCFIFSLIAPKYEVFAYHNGYDITDYLSNPQNYAGQSLCNGCVYVTPYQQSWDGYGVTLSPYANYYIITTVLVTNHDLYINCSNGGQAYIDCGFNEAEYYSGYRNWFLSKAPDSTKHDGGYRGIAMFNVINDHWLTFDNVSVNAYGNGSKETDTCVFVGATDGSTGGKLNVKGSASLMNALYGDFANCKSTVVCSNYVGNTINHGTAHIGQLGWTNTSSNKEVTAHTTAQGECSGSSGYYTCNGCGARTGTWDTRKAHSYTSKTTTNTYLRSNATCTSAATYYYKCSGCSAKGSSYYSYGGTNAHTYNKQITTDAYLRSGATCTAAATYYYACSGCNAKGSTYYSYGGKTAHNYSKKIVNNSYLKSSATCTEPAVYYYACNGCDTKGTTTYSYGSAAGHTWNNGVITTEPTVYNAGVKTYTCTKNHSHIKTENIPKLKFTVFLGNERLSLNSISDANIYQIYLGDDLLVE